MTRGRAVTLVLVAHVALDYAVALNLGFYGLAPLLYAVIAGAVLLYVAAGAPAAGSDATPSARVVACWLVALALGGLVSRSFLS